MGVCVCEPKIEGIVQFMKKKNGGGKGWVLTKN